MAGPFQEVAFNTPVGATSAPFKSTYVSAYSTSLLMSCLFLPFTSRVQLLTLKPNEGEIDCHY